MGFIQCKQYKHNIALYPVKAARYLYCNIFSLNHLTMVKTTLLTLILSIITASYSLTHLESILKHITYCGTRSCDGDNTDTQPRS